MRIGIAAVAFVLMFASLTQGAEVRSASTDEAVQTALDASAPGDTVVVAPGFFKGGWKIKAGVKDQPITLKAERAGRVFIGSLSFVSGFEKVPGSTYSYSQPAKAALPNLRELDTGKDLRWMASI